MARVYDVNPTAPGELNARELRVRVFCHPSGLEYFKIPIRRVELEEDADEGFATVHAFIMDNDGQMIAGANDDAIQASFRAYVRIRKQDGSHLGGGPRDDVNYKLDEHGYYWKIHTAEEIAVMKEEAIHAG